MKLITKIYVSIGFILFFSVLVTAVFFRETTKVDESINQVLVTTEIVKSTLSIHRAIITTQTGLRGYLLAGQEAFLDAYYEGQAEYQVELNQLKRMSRNSPDRLKMIADIEGTYGFWKDSLSDPIIAAKQQMERNPVARTEYNRLFQLTYGQQLGKLKIDAIKKTLKAFENQETAEKNQLVTQTTKSHEFTKILGIILTAISVLVGIITTILLGKTISKRMNTMKTLAANLAGGNFDFQIPDSSQDELSSLAADMNIMAQNLQKSFHRLQKMNQELDQFAYVVSHDLKAPLRAINNLAEWISEDIGPTTPEIQKNLELMRGRVLRMENLINGILEYARVGRKKMEKQPVFLSQLANEIVDSLAAPKEYSFIIQDSPIEIITEKVLLEQVLTNLMGNAVKYNDKTAGITRVTFQPVGAGVRIRVQDNGPGIPREYHEKVFGVFQTIEARDTKESTGIGLAIVKKIIEEKGGAIQLESSPGEGATFTFTWPAVQTSGLAKAYEHAR